MKKRSVILTQTLLAVLMAGVMSACGSSSYETADSAVMTAESTVAMDTAGGIYNYAPAEEAKAEAEYEEADDAAEVTEGAAEEAQNTSRKLIKNVDMSVETEDFDALMTNVERRVDELGGYIEQSDVYNGSYTSNYRSRSASLKIRIPAAKLDGFVDEVAAQSNITNKSESVDDVTLQYVDLESHKKALRAEEESLLAMLEKAETIEAIIAIQSQLTDVRYQIESMESQLRTYDNKIQYSTVWLYVDEVAQYEPYEPKTAGERISEGFMNNVHNVVDGIENFIIEFIIAIPILLVAAVVIGVGVIVVVAIVKFADKQSQKKKEQIELMKKEREKNRRPDADKQL